MQNTILNHSDILAANRLDAEYYQAKFLEPLEKIQKGKYRKLHELCEFIHVGPAGSALLACVYTPSGIKVYRPSDLNGWNCENSNVVKVSKEYCAQKHLQLYQSGDLLITRIGDVKFGIIEESNFPVTISPNLIALRVRKKLLDPYFLLAFLNTKFGLPQIQRGKKIASLSSVGIKQIANMLIPAISIEGQKRIGDAVKRGLKKIQLAKLLYSQAEKILIQETGSDKIVQSQSSTVINHSRLRLTYRADAEYFLAQKSKYQESIEYVKVGEIANVSRGIEPGSKSYQKSGKLFLRVSNISKYGLLEKSQKYIRSGLYEKLHKKYQPRVGEILLVKDGKPGVAFAINKPIEGIISEGIVRLKLNTSLAPEYISLCINSPFCQSQIRADIDGSLMPHWKIKQIKKPQIPVVPSKKRISIINNVKKSINLFQESKNDLNQAVKQVENLINNSPDTLSSRTE